MARPLTDYFLHGMLVDVSTPSSIRFYVPDAGHVLKVGTVLGSAITIADSILTVTATTPGGSTRTIGTITVAFTASAEGDIDVLNVTPVPTNSYVLEGDWIEVATDGGSTTAAQLDVTVVIRT